MYGHKLAAAIRVSGKVLREDGDKVYLPFGSEYSVYLKNLDTVRVLVTVSIDGKDISNDTRQFIVSPGGTLELERFLPNGNIHAGNRFRFIERTSGIEEHRGIGIEDGIVRIEYQFEQKVYSTPRRYLSPIRSHSDSWHSKVSLNNSMSASAGLEEPRGLNGVAGIAGERCFGIASGMTQSYYHTDMPDFTETSAEPSGITAEGSVSEQKFNLVSGFPLQAEKYSLVLRLLGKTEAAVVTKPFTVKMKSSCHNCGHTIRGFSKFCPECGTGLEVVQ